jgi:UDP-GlcNAc:undecaprenyl-phosphate GlcNAc-1-phosphate transferase
MRPIAFRFDLIDVPNERKVHQGRIPLVGGIAMFSATTFGILLFNGTTFQNSYFFFVISSFILIVLGVWDDYKHLSPKTRFIFQTISALVIILLGDVVLLNLGSLVSNENIQLGYFAILFTVFCILGVINSLNFSDGIDGLSASLSLVTFLSIAFFILRSNDNTSLDFVAYFIFSILGFLVFNIGLGKNSKYKIFMGDAGSTFLGLGIAYSLIYFSQTSNALFSPVTALWIYSIPLIDTASIMIRRINNRRSPFSPDREHLHHLFILIGWSDRKTLFFIIFLSLLMALIGICFEVNELSERLMFLLFICIAFIYYFTLNFAWKALRQN